jgi:hypothetical protein
VVVFNTEGGLLLVDGYHRLAAARRLGRTTLQLQTLDSAVETRTRFR